MLDNTLVSLSFYFNILKLLSYFYYTLQIKNFKEIIFIAWLIKIYLYPQKNIRIGFINNINTLIFKYKQLNN